VGLIDEVGSGPVAIDTAAFIYLIERHPRFLDVVRPLFEAADRQELLLVTSELTLLEVLVVPFRLGADELAQRYEALLERGRGLRLVPIDRTQLRAAAHLRALYGLRTPDALQIAAALSQQCSAFVTNDRRLRGPARMRVVPIERSA
jgi:predicted nucleic acid-binding protein